MWVSNARILFFLTIACLAGLACSSTAELKSTDTGPVDAGVDASDDAGPADSGADLADEDTPADEDIPVPDAGDAGQDQDGGPDAGGDHTDCDLDDLVTVERGDLLKGTAQLDIELSTCTLDRWTFVAAAGTVLDFTMRTSGSLTLAAVSYPDDWDWENNLAVMVAEPELAGRMRFEVPRSGEFFLQVRSSEPAFSSQYDLELFCLEGCGLESTRFPIVLVHGLMGFDQMGSDYDGFYDIPDTLGERGYPIHVAGMDPLNAVPVRAEQLAAQLDQFLYDSRARKLNLIAHSQGGLDSRYVISSMGYGDRISALVTVASPHHGTPLADVALGALPGPTQEALAFLLNLVGAANGYESDAIAAFESVTVRHVVNVFNPENPDDPRVSYISWTGHTCPLGITCKDVCDIELRFSYNLVKLMAGDNDGLIPVESGKWGDFRGTLPADHFDEIGQIGGITGRHFDHREFYLGVARDLSSESH